MAAYRSNSDCLKSAEICGQKGDSRLQDSLQRIQAAKDPQSVLEPVASLARDCGLHGLAYAGEHSGLPLVLGSDVLKNWERHYQESGYLAVDPTFAAAQQQYQPILWQADLPRDWFSPNQRQLFADAADFGIGSGLCLPVQGKSITLLGFFHERRLATPLPAEDAATLVFAGLFAHQRIMQLSVPEPSFPALTPRERDCLLWLAEGDSAAAIGWRLGITERTVGFHLQNVRSKLQVKTLPQAVARALLLGLLKPVHDVDAAASWSQRITAPSRLDARLRCDSLISQTNEKGRSFALLLLEIDHFKRIHQAMDDLSGNAILARFAHRIQDWLPPESFFAHLTGNEFLLLIPAADHELACVQAEKLLQLARCPIVWQGYEIGLTISVGIALAPAHGDSWSSLMKAADQALVQAKKSGRDRYRIHQQQQPEAGAKIHLQLESELRKALRQEELELHYQPIVSATTGAWRGFEALLRWNHPQHGELAPERLIALAESMGLIHELGFWIIQTACRQLRVFHQQQPELFMSVNLSTLQLQHTQFAHRVAEIVAAEDIPASLLELEITEQLLLEQTEDVLRNLHQLRNAGIVMSIDDFGMGHAGFGYLQTLNAHRIKIDRSFISQLHQKPERLALVKAMIQMGHGLGAQLIAEGVESEQEWQCLKALNCDLLQGFFFSKPMPGSHFDPANQI